MAEVARTAGVSVATVSHVLNETRPVRANTRDAVLAAIDELGYTHNTLARSLVTSRTNTIGIVISAISNPYFTEILQGVEAEAFRHGYTLLLADPHDEPEHELRVVRDLHQRRVDGMVLAASAQPERAVRHLAEHSVPTVFADRVVTGEHDQVSAESEEATAQLVDHLAALGHRRIGIVSGRRGLSTTTERTSGYLEGLRRNGLTSAPELIGEGNSEAEAACRATRTMLHQGSPPTAMIAANNAMTIGAMRGLREHGLRVPADVALVAFDDFPWADLFSPRLTAIAQPSQQIGVQAVRLLLKRLEDPDRPPERRRLDTEFVHRESCGCHGDQAEFA